MSKFIISKSVNDEFRFNVLDDNNQSILCSEGYDTKPTSLHGINITRINAPEDVQFDRMPALGDKSYLNFKSNRQILESIKSS